MTHLVPTSTVCPACFPNPRGAVGEAPRCSNGSPIQPEKLISPTNVVKQKALTPRDTTGHHFHKSTAISPFAPWWRKGARSRETRPTMRRCRQAWPTRMQMEREASGCSEVWGRVEPTADRRREAGLHKTTRSPHPRATAADLLSDRRRCVKGGRPLLHRLSTQYDKRKESN